MANKLLGALAFFALVIGVSLIKILWPWPMLLPPLIFVGVLAFKRPWRIRVIRCFRSDPEDERLARGLATALVLLAALYIALCLFTLSWQDVQWWLLPLLSLALALRLIRPKRPFWSAFCNNSFEFLTIATLVLAAYTVVLGAFVLRPANGRTISELKGLEEGIESAHRFLEDHSPGVWALFVALLVIYGLRLWSASASKTVATLGAGTLRWTGRISTALALAASLTFLATESEGPLDFVGLSLKDARKSYEDFHHTLATQVDVAMRRQLLTKTWTQRPPAAVALTDEAESFFRERRDYEQAVAEAARSYNLKSPVPTDAPSSHTLAPEHNKSEPGDFYAAAGAWTPSGLHTAEREVESDDPANEVAQEEFEQFLPTDQLYAAAPVIESVKACFPVFGELLDVVSSSFSEVLYDRVRSTIVDKMSEGYRGHQKVNLKAEVAAQLDDFRPDWTHFDSSPEVSERLRHYSASVARASSELHQATVVAQREQLDNPKTEPALERKSVVEVEKARPRDQPVPERSFEPHIR